MSPRGWVLVAVVLSASAAHAGTITLEMTGSRAEIVEPDGWKMSSSEAARVCWTHPGYELEGCVSLGQSADVSIADMVEVAVASVAGSGTIQMREDRGCTTTRCSVFLWVDARDVGLGLFHAWVAVERRGADFAVVSATLHIGATDEEEAISTAKGFVVDERVALVGTGAGGGASGGSSVDGSVTGSYTDENLRPGGGPIIIDYGRQPGRMLGWFQLDASRSVRDLDGQGLDPDRFPEARVLVGAALGLVVSPRPWLLRASLAASPNWRTMMGGEETDGATPSGRFGGQRYEGALEAGAAIPLGKSRLGVTAGWTGIWGPLTLSSSLSGSIVYAHLPDAAGERSFYLRVTPVRLLNSNERSLLSPLAVEAQLGVGMLMIGAEVQWIAPPEEGDDAIAGGGWSASARVGYSFVSRW